MARKKYTVERVHEGGFTEMCDRLLGRIPETGTVVRLVFFGDPADNAEYAAQLEMIGAAVAERFSGRRPAVTYVAQRPLEGGLVMEVTTVGSDADVKYGDGNRLVISDDEGRELLTGGIRAADPAENVAAQAGRVFGELGRIMEAEGFPVDAIVRQWNYIEGITCSDSNGQRYQEFNEARSRFYSRAAWREGYPAATGIGTGAGGIMVEVNALMPGDGILNVPLDNALQVAAHSYSQRVLACAPSGRESGSTPKFERARLIGRPGSATVYISGTAAIRGESSCAESDATEQTRVTMGNIEHLCSPGNINARGPAITGTAWEFALLRVYIKNPEDMDKVKSYLDSHYAHIPACYLLADVCRPELLVEIEGIARLV